MTKYGLLLVILFISQTKLAAQTTVADSLVRELKRSSGETRVDLLNRLTYEFITVDDQKVEAFNREALQLSKELVYLRGEALAYTYKGVNEYLTGYLAPAHVHLHKGLRLSKQAGDLANVGYVYLQLGNLGLEEVETDSAIHYFDKAFGIVKKSGDLATLSKIYRNMSAAYGQRFQYKKQAAYLDSAIAIRRQLPNKALLIEALVLKANNAVRAGDTKTAEDVLAEAEQVAAQAKAYEENLNDFFHIRSLILFQKGDVEQAMVLADSAREYYFRVSLIRKYVTLLIDIARVFNDRGEFELALNNLYAALELAKLRGYDSETYVIRARIGWINYLLGDVPQALQLANEALMGRPDRQLKGDRANALLLKGVALRELGKIEEAVFYLDSAYQISSDLGDTKGQCDALMSIGALNNIQRKFDAAVDAYRNAVGLAETTGYAYGLARSNWGLGNAYFKQGLFSTAGNYLDQAERYASVIHANDILVMSFNSRRDLLAAQNRFEESLQYAIKANRLSDSLHKSDLVRRFVNLEKLHQIEERDRNIKVLQQEKQLAESQITLQQARIRQQFILLVAGLTALALAVILAVVYYRFYKQIKELNTTISAKNQRIQAQADMLKEMNTELKDLYLEVSQQNEEIQEQAKKLGASNKRISELNKNLERLVEEKTAELRTTNEALVKYNNELLQFSFTVSHHLRGPVARLMGLNKLAQGESELNKAKEWLQMIGSTTLDLDQIIRDLGMLLGVRNEPTHQKELVDLEGEWLKCANRLSHELPGNEVVRYDFSGLPSFETVRNTLQNAFFGLFSNAIKYRSKKRALEVHVRSFVSGNRAVVEVRDNGMGLDTELHKDDLFKLYKRFHPHVGGRGLDLYLIKAQLDALQGTIEVASEPGQGSTFRISIPINPEEQVTAISISTGTADEEQA